MPMKLANASAVDILRGVGTTHGQRANGKNLRRTEALCGAESA